MNEENLNFSLEVKGTEDRCPVGEALGPKNLKEGKIPVLSCEGACIRGEIARVAANMVAKEDTYARGCHGELFAVPDSGISTWMHDSEKVVLIDGCFLRCHGRIMENLIDKDKLLQFDALSHYKKYQTLFDIDSVPKDERMEVSRDVADWVLESLNGGS
jgi:uncharacterized metal-binding protein